MFLEAVSQVT